MTSATATKEDLAREELKQALPKETLVDPVSLGIYATDASLYQFMPVAVVTPRNADDIALALRIATKHGVPVMPRGGGTSLAGQTANHAIVLDVSKYMTRVLELNIAEKWVRVEPGLVRDELNAELAKHGLEFAPETSTSNRAVIGGMVANNSSGMRSVRYKRTLDHLLGGRIMLMDGSVIDCVDRTPAEAAEIAKQDTPEGRIWRELIPLLEKNRDFIEERFPKVMRRVGGYSLDEFPPQGPWNLAKLVSGSEGTLATFLECKLNLVEVPKHIGMLAVHYDEMFSSFRSVPLILKHDPLSVEFMDSYVVNLSKNNPSTSDLCWFMVGDPKAILFVELTGDSEEDVRRRVDALEADLKANNVGYAYPKMFTVEDRYKVIDLRKKSLGVLLSVRGDLKPIPFIEDACIPVEQLADYLQEVVQVIHKEGLEAMLFGHASVGVIHCRPVINQKDPKHVASIKTISDAVVELVKKYKGSWSGEHGDGVSRGAQNEKFWGPEMIQVFRDTKKIFDPKGLMNPGRIFDSPPVNENLRYGGSYRAQFPKTHFRFEEFQGFDRAIEMCNGVGACRKTLGGTMCPSYMVTRDEEATTRGRANALRLAISGHFGKKGLTSERVHEVLDLCLECKACKTECPSNVDMARMKSEHLAHYHDEHGATLRDRAFAEAPMASRRISGPLATFVNAINGIGPLRKAALAFLRIGRDRQLPKFSSESLEDWFRKRGGSKVKGNRIGEVALFADCWANYYEPNAGKYAVRVLEELGYKVHLAAGHCCQRTRISKGFLAKAAQDGMRTVEYLDKFASHGIPILGIEPSCTSSLTDDLPDLVANKEMAQRVAKATMPIEAFIAQEVEAGRAKLPKQAKPAPKYLVHGHCHQKALFSTSPAKSLLAMNAEVRTNGAASAPAVTEVDSGCCGMAGSFGYEEEHQEISRKLAERKLLPAVRATDEKETVVIANGFSCRHQIKDFSGRRAMHSIEALGRALFGEW